MKKIIVFNMVSIDGYYADTNGGINWHNTDAEFNEFAISQLNEADSLIFGRVTYQLMESYWQTVGAQKDDAIVANAMNNLPKIVFSKTLENAIWHNTKLLSNIEPNKIIELKSQAKKDLFVFGSGVLVQELEQLNLIDEYRLMINPLTLGDGKKLFKQQLAFELANSKIFKNGNVLLYYTKK